VFRRREEEPLSGVFSRAWAFEPSLPSRCSENSEIHCGTVETTLPRGLRKFLELPTNEAFLIKMSVATSDNHDESYARISIGVDGTEAHFLVITQKINGERDTVKGMARKMRVERNFRDGTGEIEPRADKQKRYVGALKEVMALWSKKFREVDQTLLCGACPSHVNRLPRPVVG